MQISKLLHSCLLVEEQNTTFLFDPGIYTYEAKVLHLSSLVKLDYLLITHEHADHFHLPLVKEIAQKFPAVKIVTNQSVAGILAKENIHAAITDTIITVEETPHEKLWDKQTPENIAITIFNKLTHPGDSLHFIKSADILALPIAAPWGSTTEAVNKALEIKPKAIIPIHDWMWKDEIRTGMYQRLKTFFAEKNIDFKTPETGKIIEV